MQEESKVAHTRTREATYSVSSLRSLSVAECCAPAQRTRISQLSFSTKLTPTHQQEQPANIHGEGSLAHAWQSREDTRQTHREPAKKASENDKSRDAAARGRSFSVAGQRRVPCSHWPAWPATSEAVVDALLCAMAATKKRRSSVSRACLRFSPSLTARAVTAMRDS